MGMILQPRWKNKRERRRTGLKDLLREECERLSRISLLDCKLYSNGTRLTVRLMPKTKQEAGVNG